MIVQKKYKKCVFVQEKYKKNIHLYRINNNSTMKTNSELKVFKSGEYEYIYVYYKSGSCLLRINTHHKYIKTYMKADLYYNKLMPEYEKLNDDTKILKSKVDDYLKWNLKNGAPMCQADCLLFIKGNFKISNKPEKLTLLEYYSNFYSFKQKELNHKPSQKDYQTLQSALTDYQKKIKNILSLDSINSLDFMVDFRKFLSDSHVDSTTKGNLNDNTINKRFSCLKTFMRYIESKEIYTFKRPVMEFKTAKYDNDIIALSKEEIQQLIDIKTDNEAWQKIIDLFIFNCFCGLRYSDLIKLKQTNFIQDEDGDYYIIQENKKTGIKVQISLQQTSLDILKKYDFKLPFVCSQYFNRMIKDILKKFELFSDIVVKKNRSLKTNKDYEIMKRKLICSHTGRRTFITLAVNSNVPLNSIMLASGHSKLATVKRYMKLQPNKEAFKAIDLIKPVPSVQESLNSLMLKGNNLEPDELDNLPW